MSGPARARSPRTQSEGSAAAPPAPVTQRRAARRPAVEPRSPPAPPPAPPRPRPATPPPARARRPPPPPPPPQLDLVQHLPDPLDRGLSVDPGALLHRAILLLITRSPRPAAARARSPPRPPAWPNCTGTRPPRT